MYSLFIDTLSSPAFICLFDAEKNIQDSISWEAKHAEFDTLTESIDMLLARNNHEYKKIAKILCIVWPGGFTGIRVTTLVANTLGYSFWIPLYPVTISEFFQAQKSPLPWILPLTKTEVLVWGSEDVSSPTIMKIDTLQSLSSYSSTLSSPFLWENISYTQANNYEMFLKTFTLPKNTPLLRPMYARDPNVLVKK